MSQNAKHRKWIAADKIRIVLTVVHPGVEVSDLCRLERLNPLVQYAWKKQTCGPAERVFHNPKAKPSVQ